MSFCMFATTGRVLGCATVFRPDGEVAEGSTFSPCSEGATVGVPKALGEPIERNSSLSTEGASGVTTVGLSRRSGAAMFMFSRSKALSTSCFVSQLPMFILNHSWNSLWRVTVGAGVISAGDAIESSKICDLEESLATTTKGCCSCLILLVSGWPSHIPSFPLNPCVATVTLICLRRWGTPLESLLERPILAFSPLRLQSALWPSLLH